MALCPKAQIVLLTPFQSVQAGNTIFKVSDLIAECGHRMGLNVIRLDRQSGIYAAQEKNRHHLTTDGTHTSEQGAKRVGTFVARQLATLLQY
jgi:lysophospholipase L1-like esterase